MRFAYSIFEYDAFVRINSSVYIYVCMYGCIHNVHPVYYALYSLTDTSKTVKSA